MKVGGGGREEEMKDRGRYAQSLFLSFNSLHGRPVLQPLEEVYLNLGTNISKWLTELKSRF